MCLVFDEMQQQTARTLGSRLDEPKRESFLKLHESLLRPRQLELAWFRSDLIQLSHVSSRSRSPILRRCIDYVQAHKFFDSGCQPRHVESFETRIRRTVENWSEVEQ